MTDPSSDEDVVLIDNGGRKPTKKSRSSKHSEWAFLDSPNSSTSNGEEQHVHDSSADEEWGNEKQPRRKKRKVSGKRFNTNNSVVPRETKNKNSSISQRVNCLPRRTRYTIAADTMPLSEVQAQQRELARFKRRASITSSPVTLSSASELDHEKGSTSRKPRAGFKCRVSVSAAPFSLSSASELDDEKMNKSVNPGPRWNRRASVSTAPVSQSSASERDEKKRDNSTKDSPLSSCARPMINGRQPRLLTDRYPPPILSSFTSSSQHKPSNKSTLLKTMQNTPAVIRTSAILGIPMRQAIAASANVKSNHPTRTISTSVSKRTPDVGVGRVDQTNRRRIDTESHAEVDSDERDEDEDISTIKALSKLIDSLNPSERRRAISAVAATVKKTAATNNQNGYRPNDVDGDKEGYEKLVLRGSKTPIISNDEPKHMDAVEIKATTVTTSTRVCKKTANRPFVRSNVDDRPIALARPSRSTRSALPDWISVSELQAQERAWARLQRDLKSLHHTKDRVVELMDGENESEVKSLDTKVILQTTEESEEVEEMVEDFEPDRKDTHKKENTLARAKRRPTTGPNCTSDGPLVAVPSLLIPIANTKAQGVEFATVADVLNVPRNVAETVPHSTTWRSNLIISSPPPYTLVVPDVEIQPFESMVDGPLTHYDSSKELETKCNFLPSFGRSKQFTLTPEDATRRQATTDERVSNLIEKWLPPIRACYSRKTSAIIHEARARTDHYLNALRFHREERLVLKHQYQKGVESQVDRWVTKQLMSTVLMSPLDNTINMSFTAGLCVNACEQGDEGNENEAHRSEMETRTFVIERAIVLAYVRPLSRSTTYIGAQSSVRVEDDPILRYVPYFGDQERGKVVDLNHYDGIAHNKSPVSSSTSISGLEHEVHEYLLRLIVAECGESEAVFTALTRVGRFSQPYNEYGELKKRNDAQRLAAKQLQSVRMFTEDKSGIGEKLETIQRALVMLTGASRRRTQRPLSLMDRLGAPSMFLNSNLLMSCEFDHQQGQGGIVKPSLGLRNTNDYSQLSETFRDLFCRMCYQYDCHDHGIEHPMPSRRVDPIYPMTKYAPVMLRQTKDGETEMKGEIKDEENKRGNKNTDKEVKELGKYERIMELEKKAETWPGGVASESGSDASAIDLQDIGIGYESIVEGQAREVISRRRSDRSQTRASSLATLSLEVQGHNSRTRAQATRQKQTATNSRIMKDLSEYLDDSLLPYVSTIVNTYLAPDGICTNRCWKSVSKKDLTINGEPDEAIRARLTTSEFLLLQKIRYTVGDNACMIASILASLSCHEVHDYLVSQQHKKKSINGDQKCFSPDMNAKKHRKRGRGSCGVQTNNREILKRTRHQRLKDTKAVQHEYGPCNHEGICDFGSDCTCMKRDHMCEKACSCSRDCPNRFQGCRCSMGNCRTNACPCFVAMRECNPDLCTHCGASEVPVLVYSPDLSRMSALDLNICCNVNVQRGLHKKLGVSFSTTHGWGAFALEPIRKGEFIYEYTGAIVSHDEAERRGSIYDKMAVSFLFDLNEDTVVDAIRCGNKSKFSNHAAIGQKCHARIMRIGGEHRISIWAAADILKGEELFFNYGYHGDSAPVWSQVRITGTSRSKGENGGQGKEK